MSETPEGYGTQSTPDMGESFPPQTGDLLGGYIARLSARVRSLETASTEPSAYQRSLEARIERLEQAAQPEPFDDEGEVKPRYSHLTCLCGHGALAHYRKKSGRVRCDGNGGKCKCRAYDVTTQAVTTPDKKRVRKSLLCDQCQSPLAHGVIGGVHWCSSGFINDGEFGCRGFVPEAPAVTTPTATRERTHGRYGTRNLTKTKPIPSGEHRGDFFASDPGDVCARCGHLSTSHNATWDIDTDSTKSWCNKKGCTCAGFLLAEPEPTAEPVCATCGHDRGAHDEVGPCLVVGCRCSAFKVSPAD